MLQDRPELFMKDNTVRKLVNTPPPSSRQVRPGILVLVNDSDWELLGELEYVVQVPGSPLHSKSLCFNPFQEGDSITFISTLHGG